MEKAPGWLNSVFPRLSLFILVAIWKVPPFNYTASRGLDSSWRIGLNWAIERNLVFGRDVVFTYGPLGFLKTNFLVNPTLFRLSVLFEVAFFGLFIAALYWFSNSINLRLKQTGVFAILLISIPFPPLDFLSPILLTLLIFLTLKSWPSIGSSKRVALVLGISFLAALLAFIKFSIFLMAGGIIVLFTGGLFILELDDLSRTQWSFDEILWSPLAIAGYSASLLSIWMLSGQPLFAIVDYVSNSIPIASGYSAAMSLSYPARSTHFWIIPSGGLPIIAAVVLCGYACFLIWTLYLHDFQRALEYTSHAVLDDATRFKPMIINWYRQLSGLFIFMPIKSFVENYGMERSDIDKHARPLPVRISLLFLLFSLFAITFVSFKNGFVRYDNGHVINFLTTAPLAGILTIAATRRLNPEGINTKSVFSADNFAIGILSVLIGLLIVSLLFGPIPVTPFQPNAVENTDNFQRTAHFFVNDDAARQYIQTRQQSIRNSHGLTDRDQFKQIVGNESIDVVPWNIDLLWSMDMNWTPRPVFQSYSAYTAHLDGMNAQHLEGSPPQYIVYKHTAIDGRHPMYTNPKVMRTIVDDYRHVTGLGNGNHLLERRADEPASNPTPIQSTTAPLGDSIEVPDSGNDLVFARIHIDYSITGQIEKSLYKPAPLYIHLNESDNAAPNRYRFIEAPAENGILVSENVDRTSEFTSLLYGYDVPDNSVESFRISSPDPSDYQRNVKVEFVAVNQTSPRSNGNLVNPDTTRVNNAPGTVGSLRSIKTEQKFSLFAHPRPGGPGELTFRNVSVSEYDRLRFSIGLSPEVWSKAGNGVRFAVDLRYDNGTRHRVFSQYIDPRHNRSQRAWLDQSVDLSEHRSESVDIVLVTESGPANDRNYDWAWWGDVRLVTDNESTDPT